VEVLGGRDVVEVLGGRDVVEVLGEDRLRQGTADAQDLCHKYNLHFWDSGRRMSTALFSDADVCFRFGWGGHVVRHMSQLSS